MTELQVIRATIPMQYADKEKERKKKYYEANKEKIKERCKKYREENKEKIKERQRKCYEVTIEKRLEYGKKYKEANKEKLLEKSKKYYWKNKARVSKRNKEIRDDLSDSYVKRILIDRTDLTHKDIPQGLIEAERELIKIRRLIREET